jgi:hypothetical protein
VIALCVVLALIIAAAVGALFSAHIPILRELVDAAPLEPVVPDPLLLLAADTQADFVATRLAHLDESVDEWAARTDNQPTPSTRRPVTRVDLPAPRRET